VAHQGEAMNIVEIIMVNSARIGPLGTIVRIVDGFQKEWHQPIGIKVLDPKSGCQWIVPWANMAAIRVEEAPVPTQPAARRGRGRPKQAPQEPLPYNELPTPHSGPVDKKSLAPFLGRDA
jgi:hypothetical protein